MIVSLKDYVGKLTRAYVLILAVIALIAISCHYFAFDVRQQASELTDVVNLAGRQRMLSQKIAKAAHYLEGESVDQSAANRELRESLSLWSSAQNELRDGINPASGKSISLSAQNARLFSEIEPAFQNLHDQAQRLLLAPTSTQDRRDLLSRLRSSEQDYVLLMDQIVDEFAQTARAEMSFARNLAIVAILVTWTGLCIVPYSVFRPLMKKLIDDVEHAERDPINSKFSPSEVIVSALSQALPVMMYVKDRTLKFVSCNDRFADFIGLESAGAIAGVQHWQLSTEVEGFVEGLDEDLEIFETGNDVKSDERTYTVDAGQSQSFVVSKMVLRDEKGQATGLLGIFVDVSDYRKLEDQLAVTGKLEAIGQLAAGVAHEINTPLQYISDNTTFVQEELGSLLGLVTKSKEMAADVQAGNTEAVKTYEEELEDVDIDFLNTELPAAIEQSMQGIDSVRKIVLSMKEFSHPGDEDVQETDVNHVILSSITLTINQWKYVADLRDELSYDLPLISCNPSKLGQVIVNLIVNASHAITDVVEEAKKQGKEEKGEIRVLSRVVDEYVEIRIADTGTGIPRAAREKLFEPFFTTKEVGKGTGQGLAIAHKIITQDYGGSLNFETVLGGGTTFIIQLPIAQQVVADAA